MAPQAVDTGFSETISEPTTSINEFIRIIYCHRLRYSFDNKTPHDLSNIRRIESLRQRSTHRYFQTGHRVHYCHCSNSNSNVEGLIQNDANASVIQDVITQLRFANVSPQSSTFGNKLLNYKRRSICRLPTERHLGV